MKKWRILTNNSPETIEEVIDTITKNRNSSDFTKDLDLLSITAEKAGIDKKEVKKATKRIENAIQNNEQIIVFGDYDADGICASTILWETLYSKSKKAMPYLPDRKNEGYGLSISAIDNILQKYPDTKLIITVDNGILSHDAVIYAQEKKIDIIITDHHTKGEIYPDALSVIYTTKLCGAGVAWMLAKELEDNKDKIISKLDLVAIAAIADLVPLTDINRALVKKGLERLNATQRLGLKELIAEARIQNRKIGVYDIGYIIAPRLNAAGRVGHAIESLRLLCTNSHDNARIFAGKLSAQNRKRQMITENLTQHAKAGMKKVATSSKILIAHHKSYDEGIIGLIASKLVEEYYLPSIAISVGDEISKGSARSISGVNIIEFINKAEKYLERAGGHPMAAGFTIKTKKIEEFKKKLEEEAQRIVTDDLLIKELRIDTKLQFSLIEEALHHAIQELYPFGIGNPEPTFVTQKVKVSKFDFVGKDASHLRLYLEQEGKIIEGIGFGLAPVFKSKIGDKIDVAYTIDINEWKGRRKMNLKIKDFK